MNNNFYDRLKKTATKIAKSNRAAGSVLRELNRFASKAEYSIRFEKKDVVKNQILFSAYNGTAYACSPRAIYEFVKKSDRFAKYSFIWVFAEPEKYQWLKGKNTELVKFGSREYFEKLGSSEFWVVNSMIADHVYPKKNQHYIQCWHGTPLKRLGCDLDYSDNALSSVRDIHRRYKNDAKKLTALLSPSPFATEKFVSAWALKEADKPVQIIEEGYPRNDLLFNLNENDLQKIREKAGIPENKKIILYAPTWRDNQYLAGTGYIFSPQNIFGRLKSELGEEYIVLYRTHYLVANSLENSEYSGFVYDVSGYDDIAELYAVSDLLITDYSSVFFDFAVLKRPIIFYMYDLEKYRDELRGFYIEQNELPGEIILREEDLAAAVKRSEGNESNEKYSEFNKKYNALEDGGAAERVVKKIFKLDEGGREKFMSLPGKD